jgi:O-antigen ligase
MVSSAEELYADSDRNLDARHEPAGGYGRVPKKGREQEGDGSKLRLLLDSEKWTVRSSHGLTFVLILLYTVLVFFRPYELVSALGFLSVATFFVAIATLLVYLVTQFAVTSSFSAPIVEIKAILVLAVLGLFSVAISKDSALAWETFSDTFIKAVLIFIVLANVLQSRRRLLMIISVSMAVSLYISILAIDLYLRGEFNTEGYRVSVDMKGLFGNPNDMALHLGTMVPLAFAVGRSSKSSLIRWCCYSFTLLMVFAITITFSRGGFLGLSAACIVMAWKLGRKNRAKVMASTIFISVVFTLAAPGNYGTRMLSMFIPGLDPVGSRDSRQELLTRSIMVTVRNPWGVGIGNSTVFGPRNLQTHNAYTQVSSELGVLGLFAYLVFLIRPYRVLSMIERRTLSEDSRIWFHSMAVGLQASLIAYMVSSFFASVAYNWYVYYLVAYAICLRRIYKTETETETGRLSLQGPHPRTGMD